MHKYKTLMTGIAVLAVPVLCSAGTVTMTADDGFGASSLNSAGSWDSGAAPVAGNDYFTAGYLLRTPASGDAVFAGDSLTVQGAGGYTSPNNVALMFKGPGTNTINNLIFDGAQLRHGMGINDIGILEGGLTVAGGGMYVHMQGGIHLNSDLAGSGTITIMNTGNSDGRYLLQLSGANNTFNGNIVMQGGSVYEARMQFNDDVAMNFTVGANGVNNSIAGSGTAYLNGDFVLDLSGAGTTLGDSWLLADTGREIYGSTFSVAGFADQGAGIWTGSANGAEYEFSTDTGALSVIPEPATMGLFAVMGGGMLFIRRRFKV